MPEPTTTTPALKTQEIAFDDPQSSNFFRPSPQKPFVATPAALEAYGEQTIDRAIGKSVLLNPRRYGAITFFDHARFRLSVFAREEAQAVVAYLQHQRATDREGITRGEITAALDAFWLDRAAHAPDHDALDAHLAREAEELAAIQESRILPPEPGSG